MYILNRLQNNSHPGVERAANKETARLSDAHHKILGDISAIKNSQESLVGKTIEPRFASMTMSHISYDGHGKILSIKYLLSPEQYNQLAAHVIPDLSATPAKSETVIRTPQECLFKIATVIKKGDIPNLSKQNVLANIRNIFLTGYVTPVSIHALHNSLQILFPNHSELLKEIKEVVASLEKEVYLTKHNDNFYGRLFETELAQKVVDSPSPEMQNNTEILKDVIINDFRQLNEKAKKEVCKKIQNQLKGDPATWRSGIPEVKAYLKKCSAENLLRMINIKSELKHLLIMHLSVKYFRYTPEYRPLLLKATNLYSNIIKPQRQFEANLNKSLVKSSRTGIQLHYQLQAQAEKATGERPIDRYRPLVNDITEHNRLALIAEKPIGIGMSGSANILNYVFVTLAKQIKDFDIDHARLYAASFLTYSGGHSFNEAYTVFAYPHKQTFKPLTYASMGHADPYINHAITDAYDKVVATAMAL